jgi:hypothetical protein
MGTCIKRGLTLGLLGVGIWCLASWLSAPDFGPDRNDGSAGISLTRMNGLFEFSSAWGQGISGAPGPYRGRLMINYPLLMAILLFLLLVAVLGVAWILNQLFTTKLKTLEKRIAYLEYTVKDLYARQKEDLDGLLRQIHNLPGKAKSNESKKDPEKDTTVGKSPIPREPNP